MRDDMWPLVWLWPTTTTRSVSYWTDQRKKLLASYWILYSCPVEGTALANTHCGWRQGTRLSAPCEARVTSWFGLTARKDGMGPLLIVMACDHHTQAMWDAFGKVPFTLTIPREETTT